MTREQHASVLYAYLSRMTPANVKGILEAEMKAWHAATNYPLGAQLAAQKQSMDAIEAALDRMLDSDLNNIQLTIDRSR